jgi:hypothetical protein
MGTPLGHRHLQTPSMQSWMMGGRRTRVFSWAPCHMVSGMLPAPDRAISPNFPHSLFFGFQPAVDKVGARCSISVVCLQSFLTVSSDFSLQWIRKVLELGKDKVMGFTGELVPILLGFETSGPRGKTGPVKSQARLIALQLRDLIRSAGRDAAVAVVDYSQVRE